MGRLPKTTRVPRTRNNGKWTEAAFWGFLRSGIRRLSTRWEPVTRTCFANVRRPSQSVTNKRLKWEYQCAVCENWFKREDVQADHIVECGSLKSFEDLPGFCERLFCEADGVQVLCKGCHHKKTQKKDRR